MTEQPNVQQALAAAAAEIGAVGKEQTMAAGPAKYKYRGLDDLMNAVHGPLSKHGVTFVPIEVNVIDKMERTTRSGSVQYHLRAVVTYAIYGPAGDMILCSVLAEGADTGDKAGNKLMSGAFKYALGQALHLPYAMEDQDESIPQEVQAISSASVTIPNSSNGDLQKLHNVLADYALTLDVSMEQITSKFREANGGLTLEEFYKLPPDRIRPFIRQISDYAAKEKPGRSK